LVPELLIACAVASGRSNGAPQVAQNVVPGAMTWPFVHRPSRGAPQSRQKRVARPSTSLVCPLVHVTSVIDTHELSAFHRHFAVLRQVVANHELPRNLRCRSMLLGPTMPLPNQFSETIPWAEVALRTTTVASSYCPPGAGRSTSPARGSRSVNLCGNHRIRPPSSDPERGQHHVATVAASE